MVLALCMLSTAMLVGPAVRPPALRARANWRACPAILMADPAPKPLKMSEKVALVAEELGLELDGLKVATAASPGKGFARRVVQIVREEVPALVFIQGFIHDILRSLDYFTQWVLQLGKYEPIAINHLYRCAVT